METHEPNGYFHGDCKSFIRFHKREYVTDNVQIRDANTLDQCLTSLMDCTSIGQRIHLSITSRYRPATGDEADYPF